MTAGATPNAVAIIQVAPWEGEPRDTADAQGLVLTELAPDRSAQILQRARADGNVGSRA